MICAGHGKYSYCQPASGFNPSWFAVMAVEKMNLGDLNRYLPRAVVVALTALRTAPALFTQPRFLGSALLALFHQAALWRRFLNPPKRACFFGCTRWIVRMASFAKPCVRRSARRSA